jgi:hypothetical protein
VALTSPTSSGRSVGTVRLRTKATEFFFNVEEYLPEEQQPVDLWVMLPKKASDDLIHRHGDLFLKASKGGALTLAIAGFLDPVLSPSSSSPLIGVSSF